MTTGLTVTPWDCTLYVATLNPDLDRNPNLGVNRNRNPITRTNCAAVVYVNHGSVVGINMPGGQWVSALSARAILG